MSLSLIVNVIVSALMIGRIYHVYKHKCTVDPVGRNISWVASVLLESAIPLCISQAAYLALYSLRYVAFGIISGPVTIIYVSESLAFMP